MTRNARLCATAIALALLAAPMAACAPKDVPFAGDALDSLSGDNTRAEARLTTAAANAIAEGRTSEALTHYERLYKRQQTYLRSPITPESRDIALNYAQLLRKTGKSAEAVKVIEPLITGKDGQIRADAPPVLINEYAAIQIELGRLDIAKKLLPSVLNNPAARPLHADAANLTGIVLDAEGQHAEAEKMFRLALETWKGDNTSVMNNLAICLASRGRFDESLLMLNRALVLAPNKSEIARNIEIVQSLRDAVVPKAPVPLKSGK